MKETKILKNGSCPECQEKDFSDPELKEIKREIIRKINTPPRKINWGNFLITFLLFLLLLISLAQTVQSATILKKIQSEEFLNLQNSSSSNLEDLPEMVGGC